MSSLLAHFLPQSLVPLQRDIRDGRDFVDPQKWSLVSVDYFLLTAPR